MNNEQNQEPKEFRLALRLHGEYYMAFFALQNTMEGAISIGAIRAQVAQRDEKLMEQWTECMKATVKSMLLGGFVEGVAMVIAGDPKPLVEEKDPTQPSIIIPH